MLIQKFYKQKMVEQRYYQHVLYTVVKNQDLWKKKKQNSY